MGFGLHTAFDQTGAVLGPLMVAAAVAQSNHFGPAFLRLAIPAAAALIALLVARAINPPATAMAPRETISEVLPRVFWFYVVAAGMLACGFVDFPLLAYHFQKTALLRPATIPLLYAGAMAMNGIAALIFGILFDRFGIVVLVGGILLSVAALPLGFQGGPGAIVASIAFWGLGIGAQDACLRSGIAQLVSIGKRGSAFGVYNAIYGVMWFAGSAAMGLLYDHSVFALVVFGVSGPLCAAAMFPVDTAASRERRRNPEIIVISQSPSGSRDKTYFSSRSFFSKFSAAEFMQ